MAETEAKRKEDEKLRNEKKLQVKCALSDIDEQIKSKEERIRIADEAMMEGNKKLQAALSTKPLLPLRLQSASLQIDMGIERKRKLVEEMEILKKQRLETTFTDRHE